MESQWLGFGRRSLRVRLLAFQGLDDFLHLCDFLLLPFQMTYRLLSMTDYKWACSPELLLEKLL